MREWRNSLTCLGYREITLKSETEPAFRNRVAEMCKAEITTEDGVKGDNESNGLIENAVMLPRGIIRTINCHIESSTQDESLVLPWLWSMQVASNPDVKRVVTGRRHLKDCMARNRHKSSSRLVRKCWQSESPQIP